MSKYIYKNPLDNGYKQFKISKKQHNKLFKYRQIKWYDKYEYYYNKEILIHKFYNPISIILNTILFPMAILIHGLGNFKECYKDLKELYHQKKYGCFSCDTIQNKSEEYDEIMEIINKKNK